MAALASEAEWQLLHEFGRKQTDRKRPHPLPPLYSSFQNRRIIYARRHLKVRDTGETAGDLLKGRGKQFHHINIECLCKALDDLDRRITGTTLNAADVGAIESMLERKTLLAESCRLTQPAQIRPYSFAHVHRPD